MPRKRCGLAAICASSTGGIRSPSRRSAVPTIPAATRVSPYRPLALIAAMPCTNSVSPTTLNSSGPSAPYIDVHSMNTVWRTLCRPIPQVVMRVDDRKPWLEGRLVGQRQPVLGLGPVVGRLLGPRFFRHETFQGACGGETTERIPACAIEKTPARDVIHTLVLSSYDA